MNINAFMPKHINMEELAAQVPNYSGTFAEFADMLLNHEVTLATDNEGRVIDFWVHASENPMLDALIGQTFAKTYALSYSYEIIMTWLSIIIRAKQAGLKIEDIDEEAGTCKIGGSEVRIGEPKIKADEEADEKELPEYLEIYLPNVDDLAGYMIDCDDDAELEKWVKRYLRYTYKHCLARGSYLDIEIDRENDNLVDVRGIKWGRALTEKELENLKY